MASTINIIPGTNLGAIIRTSDSSSNLAIQTNSTNALVIDRLQNITISSATALGIPSGNTAQRPASPVNGMIRYNTDFGGVLEGYANNKWTAISDSYTYQASYLIVAGGAGGGGGGGGSGGGGAGGLLTGTQTLTTGVVYSFTVGTGGPGGSEGTRGSNGLNSTGLGLTAIGGGGGGCYGGTQSGAAGGSGGGANNSSGGNGTPGQGNAGGPGYNPNNEARCPQAGFPWCGVRTEKE